MAFVTEPATRLALSVLALAVEEATAREPADTTLRRRWAKRRVRAIVWLAEGGEAMEMWCALADVAPEAVRRRLREQLATPEQVELQARVRYNLEKRATELCRTKGEQAC